MGFSGEDPGADAVSTLRTDLERELERMDAVASLMRRHGILQVQLVGLSMVTSEHAPPAQAEEPRSTVAKGEPIATAPKDDADEALDRTEREEQERKALWASKWSRLTRSAGGSIPPMPANPDLVDRWIEEH